MQKTTAVAPAQAQSRPLLAIGLLCTACALFACGDTTAKYLATVVGAPIGQIVWMRYFGQFVGTVAMLGLIAVPAMLRTTKLKAQLFRSVLLLDLHGVQLLGAALPAPRPDHHHQLPDAA